MVKFDTDENLGKTIAKRQLFSKVGVKPITDLKTLHLAAGRSKMSKLCGFRFTSANKNNDYKEFEVAFVCKTRSKINHQQKKHIARQWTIPSRWFVFKIKDDTHWDVMASDVCMGNYGFDIDEFFESDLFKRSVKRFQQTVKSGIKQLQEFAETIEDKTERQLALDDVRAIELSIPLIAKTEYENKNYSLVDFGVSESEEQLDEAAYNFDKYDWKDGSITGKGLIALISDTDKYSYNNAVKIYDRKSGKFYDIIDSMIDYKNSGLVLDIDTSKESTGKAVLNNNESEDMKKQIDKSEEKLKEADEREPLAHALDPVGVKASTANSIEQDAVEMTLIEKEDAELEEAIDKDIEEAMEEIYK